MNDTANTRNYHAAAYRTATSIFLALALGGLFIGLLTPVLANIKLFACNYFALGVEAAPEGTTTLPAALDGSLFGYIWYFFETMFKPELLESLDFAVIGNCLMYARPIFLCGTVVAAIICFVVSLCSKKSARACALASAVLVTAGYTWIYVGCLINPFILPAVETIDILHLCFVGLLIIGLAVVAIGANKGAGVVSVIGLLLTLGVGAACVWPGSLFKAGIVNFLGTPVVGMANEAGEITAAGYFDFLTAEGVTAAEAFGRFVPVLLFALAALCGVVSFIRPATKKGYTFDAVRYALLFVTVVLFVIGYVVSGAVVAGEPAVLNPEVEGAIEGGGFVEFFKNGDTLYIEALLLVIASGVLLILFVVAAIIARGKARRDFVNALSDSYDEDEDAPGTHNHLAPVYINNVGTAPAAAPATVATVPAAAPTTVISTPAPAAAPIIVNIPAPAPQPAPIYNVYPPYAQPTPYGQNPYAQPAPYGQNPYGQPAPYGQPNPYNQQPAQSKPYVQPYIQPIYYPVATNTAPAAAPAPAAPAAPADAAAPAPAEPPMSDFEQRMAALVSGDTSAPAAPAPAPVAAVEAAPASVSPAAPAPAPQPEAYGTYVYDTFFTSLPAQEKNEFGDLFIGKKYGDFGLPTYNIGEDNSEFFHKFFIYLSKIRPHISSELLGKVYDYINGK